MRNSFQERAAEMGLNDSLSYKGLFSYSDQFVEVIYRQLTTTVIFDDQEKHKTDGSTVPIMGIYIKPHELTDYLYCGYVSDLYQFIGNNILIEQIKSAINQVGLPVVSENPLFSYNRARMRNEIIISSSYRTSHGDVLPVLIVENSYDGTKAATVSFGISTIYNNHPIVFSFTLGSMRQVHIQNANTTMASVVSSYMEIFQNNILDMIEQSFQSKLTAEQMLGTLDLIEKIGKRKREDISKLLQELNPSKEGEEPPLPSAWQMFLAIVRYSSLEPNLNSKRLLENAAESVLVIPTRMYDVLNRLSS